MHFIDQKIQRKDKRLPLYSFKETSFLYSDETKALEGISLDIFDGDRIALLGQNGSGKSTLIKHLNGLLVPTSGALLYKGEPFNQNETQSVRLKTGILFQDPDDHLFCSTLYDDVAFGPMNQGLPEALVKQRVNKALEAAELANLLFKPAHQLSFGQKKRAAFAAVMAMKPDVLILDEPSANLDPRQVSILKQQLSDFDGTLICISHDLFFLHGLCQRAVVLSKGEIHHDYTFDDLLEHTESLKGHGLDFSFRFKCCSDHSNHVHNHKDSNGLTKNHRTSERRCADSSLIHVENYNFTYPDGTLGLDNININIASAEKVALIGENGAGKSTLAMMLLGNIKGHGVHEFKGEAIDSKNYKYLWKDIGIVFQDSADQLFCPSCWDEVAFGPKNCGCSDDEVSLRVDKALEMVGLKGYEKKVPLNMSGGERKRLAIAAALAIEPEVLVLDEPTAGLDPQGEELLLDIITSLPVTLVLVTHDLFFISELTQRTIVMHHGRVICDYSTHEFLNDSKLQSLNQLDYSYKNICHHGAGSF